MTTVLATQIEIRGGECFNNLQHAVNWWLADMRREHKSFTVKDIKIETTQTNAKTSIQWHTIMITYEILVEFNEVGDPILISCCCDHESCDRGDN